MTNNGADNFRFGVLYARRISDPETFGTDRITVDDYCLLGEVVGDCGDYARSIQSSTMQRIPLSEKMLTAAQVAFTRTSNDILGLQHYDASLVARDAELKPSDFSRFGNNLTDKMGQIMWLLLENALLGLGRINTDVARMCEEASFRLLRIHVRLRARARSYPREFYLDRFDTSAERIATEISKCVSLVKTAREILGYSEEWSD